jgi:hypothetical protein
VHSFCDLAELGKHQTLDGSDEIFVADNNKKSADDEREAGVLASGVSARLIYKDFSKMTPNVWRVKPTHLRHGCPVRAQERKRELPCR